MKRHAKSLENFKLFEPVFKVLLSLDAKPHTVRVPRSNFPSLSLGTLHNRFSEALMYGRETAEDNSYELLRARIRVKSACNESGEHLEITVAATRPIHTRRASLTTPDKPITLEVEEAEQPQQIVVSYETPYAARPVGRPSKRPAAETTTTETAKPSGEQLKQAIQNFLADITATTFIQELDNSTDLAQLETLLAGRAGIITTIKNNKLTIVKD